MRRWIARMMGQRPAPVDDVRALVAEAVRQACASMVGGKADSAARERIRSETVAQLVERGYKNPIVEVNEDGFVSVRC